MPINSTQPAIALEHISFSFNGNKVLDDVSFTVDEGEYLGIIGPNGSGKTTLLKIIVGLLSPHEGSVKIFGSDIRALKDRSRIGYVPQRVTQTDVHFPATVREIVESGRTARQGILKGQTAGDRAAVERALAVAGIEALADRLVGDLSGGERQRVFIARALAGEPRLLILDEPTTGVDTPAQDAFYEFLDGLNHRDKITILVVSHDIDVVAHEARCLVCLNRKLVCHGAPGTVLKEGMLNELYGTHLSHIHKAP